MTNTSIKHLLQQVTLLRHKHDEIARITGEQFNVFEILDISTQEVRMHSALLGELLNRNGTHGCNSIFLDCFLEQLKKKNINHPKFLNRIQSFNSEESTTLIEYHIGYKNEAATEGGRIDILIVDNENNSLIIENKIYAGDQFNQLVRYNNFKKEAPIFYLTLNGDKPSDYSRGHLTESDNFICLSYKEDIINWLEVCLKEAANVPLLRETIKQYINLLKILTNQTTYSRMSIDIKEQILKDIEAFQSAKTIADEYYKTVEEIKSMVAKDLEYSVENIISWNEYQIGFWITYETSVGWFFGFSAHKDGNYAVNKAKDLIPIVNILKQIDPSYKNSDYYMGYKNCYNPNDNRSFVYIDNLDIFQLHDKNYRDAFILKVHQNAKSEIDVFVKKVNELKNANADSITA